MQAKRICINCRHYKPNLKKMSVTGKCTLSGDKVLSTMRQCPMYAPHPEPKSQRNHIAVTREFIAAIWTEKEVRELATAKFVDVSKTVKVVDKGGVSGTFSATATAKVVKVTFKVKSVDDGGGFVTIELPWGKIYGMCKSRNGK